MARPDYWQKPIRTSRDGSTYGNTRLGEPDPRRGTIRLTLLLILLFVLLVTVGSETVRAILWGVPA